MSSGLTTLLVLSLLAFGGDCRCGERLARALDSMQQRGHSARRRHDGEDADAVYHQRLHSAPIDVSVTKLLVEIPRGPSGGGGAGRDGVNWARVERCAYEPSNNSVRSRVGFSELAVSGTVQLVVREADSPGARGLLGERLLPAESCRMSLRLRRAGMEFYTSPIARGRGQMRIRTESSFLEPRFASIYAYGCRAVLAPRPAPATSAYDRVESEPRKRELAEELNSLSNSTSREAKEFTEDDSVKEENRLGASVSALPSGYSSNDALLDSLWRSRGDIAREMEDVFLRSASQAITHYIERQLHPAIKETLMMNMGFTISYG